MLLHSDPLFSIYFGDERERFDHQRAREVQSLSIFQEHPFKKLIAFLKVNDLIFLRQVHGTDGLLVRSSEQAAAVTPFMSEGDFIITNIAHVGLGIATGDCLPIIMFDKTKHVVAMIHAGWRGSVAGVALKALECMRDAFDVQLNNLRIFMGPSAKACCYVVGDTVLKEIERYPYCREVIYQSQGKTYLDLPLFNMLLLEEHGVKREAFHVTYSLCTICDPTFCSYRRNGSTQWRQMSIVTLK